MKTMPTIAPGCGSCGARPRARARRRLELDLVGFDFGDTHETRILGLMRA